MSTITVFTPTYNRAYCLGNCYDSLKRQTSKDFEWLIIDDGSTDNTKELVNSWIENEKDFVIRYIYKENGGMHTGYNTAYENITTELSVNIDSDDYMTNTAIEDILNFWKENKREDVGGIYALDMFENGEIVGLPFPDDLKEFQGWGYKTVFYAANGKRKKFKNRGDKKFIGVTKIINKYPKIPVFEGEKYYSLYFKQHQIEKDYKILIYNKPVCVVEYRQDGSSSNMYNQYVKNPNGFCNERKFVMQYAPEFSMKFNAAIHYVAESILARNKNFIKNSTAPFITLLAVPIGVLLWIVIKKKAKK